MSEDKQGVPVMVHCHSMSMLDNIAAKDKFDGVVLHTLDQAAVSAVAGEGHSWTD